MLPASPEQPVKAAAPMRQPTPIPPRPDVTPEQSRRWAWQPEESLPPRPTDADPRWVHSMGLSADGSLLAVNDRVGITTAWHIAADFAQSKVVWQQGGEGTSNVDVSRDGTRVAISGDVHGVLDARDGSYLSFLSGAADDAERDAPLGSLHCLGGELRFSTDGTLLAGKRYGSFFYVYDGLNFKLLSKVETHGCSGGIAFAPDDLSVVTPEGAYETNTFTQIAAGSVDKAAAGSYFEGSGRRFVTLTPDGSEKFITDCSDLPCTTTIDSVSIHGGQHPVFSAEGHWLVSGGKLFHRPSGTLLQFDDTASEALFTPAGDIIVGESNGALKFYRRHESTAP